MMIYARAFHGTHYIIAGTFRVLALDIFLAFPSILHLPQADPVLALCIVPECSVTLHLHCCSTTRSNGLQDQMGPRKSGRL